MTRRAATPARLGTDLPRALDFVARPAWGAWAWGACALAVVACVLAASAVSGWRQQGRQVDELAARLSRQAPARAARAAPPTPQDLSLERDALLSAQELGVAWGALLTHLAQQGQRDIALTQLEPDATAGSLLIGGQASTPEAALAYARRLADGAVLEGVQLLSHEPTAEAKQLPTRFRIAARWSRTDAAEVPPAGAAAEPSK
ncbi:hypothetical protein [Ideonella sp. A 288]|uniref:hypothetical protein n=1 Tax=Ideonella sp. A 288 TaxID=1962181 RepID=UPI000B4B84B5|nr:hypothetical protein [Ideonella sp. A 288]